MSTPPATAPIWAFNALLVAGAVAAAVGASGSPGSLLPVPYGVSWLLLIPIGVICELCMFSVRYRADAQTFSLGEITLVLGIAFLPTPQFLVAQMLGLFISYVIRGLVPIRATFNLAATALTSGIAVMITRGLVGDRPDPRTSLLWVAMMIGAAATAPIQSGLVALVRSVAERRWLLRDAPRMALFAQLNTVAVAAVAVVVAHVVADVAFLAVIALLPLLLVYVFCRQLLQEHTLRTDVEFLYETAQAIHRTPDAEQALENLLDRARTSFLAEYGAVFVRRADTGSWLSFSIGSTAYGTSDITKGPTWLPDGTEAVVIRPRGNPPLGSRDLLRQLGAVNAMAAALRNEDDLIGVFVLADRRGGVIEFDEQNRRLFTLLASQVAIGLQNAQMERSLGALSRLEEELRHQAHHDALTGLANRTLMYTVLARHGEEGRSVMLIDLDDFKTINDSLGHAAGDEVLVLVADRLRSEVHGSDLVVRLGGDEFAVVLHGDPLGQRARHAARAIEIAIAAPMRVAGRDVEIGCSIGIAVGAGDLAPTALIRNADVAMYAAKHDGKGRHVVFEPGMDDAARERLQIISGLRSAVGRAQLSLVYQPIVELASGATVAVEALVRWEHDELGPLSPDRFIPLAEQSGLIVGIGRWILEHACAEVAALTGTHAGRQLELHVNVSPRQIADPGFGALVEHVIDSVGFDPARLVLEVTEQTALSKSETVVANVEQLRAIGVRLALDDFGTGYSSVAAAHRFPINLIKIDQLFIRTLDDGSDSSLVRAILAMADSLGLASVAEGIETAAQMEVLVRLGCPYGQGYLFARPSTMAALVATWAAIAATHDAAMVSG